jgi:capsular exopolysaccharide synthesis family protein
VDKTSVFKVYVYDENPEYAQRIANTIGELAPDRIISIVKSGGIEIMEKAELPVEPYESTSVRMFALLGAVGGAMLAALWAVIRGLNDTTIRRPYEVTDRFCPEILAQIPQMKNSDEAVLCKNCEFELREAYRDLRSALLCRHEEEMCQLYAVTSADPGEGKTLIAKNLAASAAEAGRKVLLLQADVRKAEEGNAGKEIGAAGSLAEYLRGDAEKIHPQQCESGAFLLPQGDLTKDGAELLFGAGFTGLLKKCRKEYDLILVDLPPLAVFSDALCMADEADGYLIVVREKVTRTERTELVLRRLESAGAAVRGFVYNGISRTSPDYNFAEKAKNYGYHENCVKNKTTDLKVQTNA